ncbi:DUF932 domain-containing protein [Gordonia alkanivorans]|uniref:DUF932 domain-containing protein n=1 Tax=Gordonia alkanivorans TaxID=84096 RepID=UPI0004B79863|nr:DUF932 domain-containing protein [Gordonia alkanivorans]
MTVITPTTPVDTQPQLRRPAEAVLGTDVRQARNIDEVLHIAGMDWDIVTADDADGLSVGIGDRERSVFMPGRKLLMRADAPVVLGMVGTGYEPLSNREAFALADVAHSMGAQFTSAGESDHGRKAWVSMDLPEAAVKIGGKDLVQFSIDFRTSHAGEGSVAGRVRGHRLACLNGLSVSLSSDSAYAERHTASVTQRLAFAERVVRGAIQWAKEFSALGEALITTPTSRSEFRAYVEHLYPEPDPDRKVAHDRWAARQADLMGLFTTSTLQSEGRGTSWAAVNAVTEHDQWWRSARSDESRARRQFEGDSERFSAHAFRAIREMAGV